MPVLFLFRIVPSGGNGMAKTVFQRGDVLGGFSTPHDDRIAFPAPLGNLLKRKKAAFAALVEFRLERATGLEPATSTLARLHSTN